MKLIIKKYRIHKFRAKGKYQELYIRIPDETIKILNIPVQYSIQKGDIIICILKKNDNKDWSIPVIKISRKNYYYKTVDLRTDFIKHYSFLQDLIIDIYKFYLNFLR